MHLGSYDALADEYYNARRHPTSADFRRASAMLLARWKSAMPKLDSSWACEIGAGRSLIAELWNEWFPERLRKLLVLDQSAGMLRWSRDFARTAGTRLLLGDAARLPLASGSLTFVASVLGDGYNTSDFWNQVSRVLEPSGVVIFTTPSRRWAEAFRSADDPGFEWADFELEEGEHVLVPSIIVTPSEQVRMIEEAGLVVKESHHVPLAEMSFTTSPKLGVLDGTDPVVEGFVAVKP